MAAAVSAASPGAGPRDVVLRRDPGAAFGFSLRGIRGQVPAERRAARAAIAVLQSTTPDPQGCVWPWQFALHQIAPASPAAHAGLSPADVLVAVNGAPVAMMSLVQVVRAIKESHPSTEVRGQWRRWWSLCRGGGQWRRRWSL